MTRITVWIDWISTLCAKMGKVIVLVGGTGILLSMAIGVFSRALLPQAFVWPEEVSRYLLIWCTFIGGSVALHNKNLVRFEFIINLFKGKAYTVAEIVGHLLSLVFLVLFTRIGIDLIPYYLNSVGTTVPVNLAGCWCAAGRRVYGDSHDQPGLPRHPQIDRPGRKGGKVVA